MTRVLTVMATCGMYDYSGNWIFQVGMPAKSGVGGGVVAVLPGQFGLAVYSPRLDAKWNSVRGIAVCEALSRDYGMHMLRVTRSSTTSVIRSAYTAAEISSKLNRDPASLAKINRDGDRIQVMELTGELTFVTAEMVVGKATESLAERKHLILDLSRVAAIDRSATILLAEMIESFVHEQKQVFITGWHRHFTFYQTVRERFCGKRRAPQFDHQDIDRALESAENGLLLDEHGRAPVGERVDVADQFLCRGLDDVELELLQEMLVEERYEPGETICAEGEVADRVFFLCRGRVTVALQLDRRHDRRLGAFVAGWAFGEAAFFKGRRRNADIVAETPVEVAALDPGRLRDTRDPVAGSLLIKLMANLAEQALDRLGQANQEIRVLSQ